MTIDYLSFTDPMKLVVLFFGLCLYAFFGVLIINRLIFLAAVHVWKRFWGTEAEAVVEAWRAGSGLWDRELDG